MSSGIQDCWVLVPLGMDSMDCATKWPTYAVRDMVPTAMTGLARRRSRGRRSIATVAALAARPPFGAQGPVRLRETGDARHQGSVFEFGVTQVSAWM
ncbi:hypothetical protein GCM10022295_90850 [Streptomyces osmaniensis]|uniref:Uncharacterized protein n=1 Tax=Streptomyces osmaniensis TaxID=593134 RepID=A0ABP6Z408_9ACTN